MANVPLRPTSMDTYPASEAMQSNGEPADVAALDDNLFDGEVVDRVFRGRGSGAQLLAVTSQRIMIVERAVWDGRCALTSIPFGRVTALSFLADDEHPIDQAVTVGIRVQSLAFEVEFGDADQAREAHDLITWSVLHPA